MSGQAVELFGHVIPLYQALLLAAALGLAVGLALAGFTNKRSEQKAIANLNLAELKERAASNAAFMKGINYILADETDRAIEELTKAVEVDTETVETYVALGNLFRSKGEIDRAIRIRQSIMFRPKLDKPVKIQAQYDLGVDYRRGGFLDRAVTAFEEVLRQDPRRVDALRELVLIYEETRQWDKASEALTRLGKVAGRKVNNILAHYQVEAGLEFLENGMEPQAHTAYKKALMYDSKCLDAYIRLGDLHLRQGKEKKAVSTWRKAVDSDPARAHLLFERLSKMSEDMNDARPVMDFLSDPAHTSRNPLARMALGDLLAREGRPGEALEEYKKAVSLDPGFIEARRRMGLLLFTLDRKDEALESCGELLKALKDPAHVFQCGNCGLKTSELMWRCPQCCTWDAATLLYGNHMMPDEDDEEADFLDSEGRTSTDAA